MEQLRSIFRRLYIILRVTFKRLLPIVTFFIFFVILGSLVDRALTEARPATDYIRYYSFNVQNAREGEDVNFQVCRSHDQNYSYNGNLSVYVIPDSSKPNEDAGVFSKDIGGSLRPGECENKVLLATEFHHAPGKYKMYFTINFREPRYQFEKKTNFTSNIYTIYPQPTELNAKIDYLEQQLEQAKQQLEDLNAGKSSVDSTLAKPSSQSSQSSTPPPVTVQPAQPAQPPTHEVCSFDLLGLGLIKTGCRQEAV